jgi:DNA (cytosine-5)-methyltransferase 1
MVKKRKRRFRLGVPHHEAIRILLSLEAMSPLSKSIRAKLPSIVSHWLQSPDNPPLLLGKRRRKRWRKSLLAYENAQSVFPPKRQKAPPKRLKIDYSTIPFPPVKKSTFTFIDLFCGIGGFRVALQNLGGKCLFSNDWNHNACETYFKNFGEIPFGDIRDFTGKRMSDDELDAAIPDHDVLAAGFPCQPFSKAGISARTALGRKHGFDCDTQGELFFDIIRIAKIKRPKVIVLENVANLTKHDGGKTLRKIKDTIEQELGYSFSKEVIDASPVVPQKRRRCYIVCLRKSSLKFKFPRFAGRPKQLRSVLEDSPPPQFTISDRLWNGHIKRTRRNLNRGVNFTAFESNLYKPANTLVARYFKDGKECLIPQNGKNPRKLTIRECARLQGYPEEFLPHQLDRQAYQQFGNSVVVPIVERIAAKFLRSYV